MGLKPEGKMSRRRKRANNRKLPEKEEDKVGRKEEEIGEGYHDDVLSAERKARLQC